MNIPISDFDEETSKEFSKSAKDSLGRSRYAAWSNNWVAVLDSRRHVMRRGVDLVLAEHKAKRPQVQQLGALARSFPFVVDPVQKYSL